MLQIGLIVGLIVGFMLRGWLERMFPFLFRKKRKEGDAPGAAGEKPDGIGGRIGKYFLDGIFKPKGKDEDKGDKK